MKSLKFRYCAGELFDKEMKLCLPLFRVQKAEFLSVCK